MDLHEARHVGWWPDTSKSMQADEEDEDVDARDFTVVFRLIDNRKPKKLRKTKCDFSRPIL